MRMQLLSEPGSVSAPRPEDLKRDAFYHTVKLSVDWSCWTTVATSGKQRYENEVSVE